jgi:hypothetical protein
MVGVAALESAAFPALEAYVGGCSGACLAEDAPLFTPRCRIISMYRTSRRAGYVQRGLCGGCAPHESLIRWTAAISVYNAHHVCIIEPFYQT